MVAMQRFGESLADSERALQASPLDRVLINHLGWHLFQARQYEAAADVQTKELQLFPEYGMALALRGFAEERRNERRRAIDDLLRARIVLPMTWIDAALAFSHAAEGNTSEARAILDELRASASRRYVSAFDFALVYAGLGERAAAFEWLERAIEERSPWIAYLAVDPRLDELRMDGRFGAILSRCRGGA